MWHTICTILNLGCRCLLANGLRQVSYFQIRTLVPRVPQRPTGCSQGYCFFSCSRISTRVSDGGWARDCAYELNSVVRLWAHLGVCSCLHEVSLFLAENDVKGPHWAICGLTGMRQHLPFVKNRFSASRKPHICSFAQMSTSSFFAIQSKRL